jgi:hypothetical protein
VAWKRNVAVLRCERIVLRVITVFGGANFPEEPGGGLIANVAVTRSSLEIVAVQGPWPEQAPLQPENVDPEAACATSGTSVPAR